MDPFRLKADSMSALPTGTFDRQKQAADILGTNQSYALTCPEPISS